ncbi:hypothetical protein EMIT079MI2_340008 [Bacillus sp. IT-79MI2]
MNSKVVYFGAFVVLVTLVAVLA